MPFLKITYKKIYIAFKLGVLQIFARNIFSHDLFILIISEILFEISERHVYDNSFHTTGLFTRFNSARSLAVFLIYDFLSFFQLLFLINPFDFRKCRLLTCLPM